MEDSSSHLRGRLCGGKLLDILGLLIILFFFCISSVSKCIHDRAGQDWLILNHIDNSINNDVVDINVAK